MKSRAPDTRHQLRVVTSQLDVYARDLRRTLDQERTRSRDLARANARLDLLDRLKRDFLRFISHELRTPLSAFSALDLVDLTDPAEAEQLVGFARGAYERMSAFVERGLNYFQALSMSSEQIDDETEVPPLLTQLVNAHRVLSSDAADVAVVFDADLPPVHGSLESIREVLSIVLDNAAKFGGPAPTVRVSATHHGDGVMVRVSDDGKGFPPELGAELVRPFTVADITHHHGGTGLSLSLAAAIVEVHGGSLEISSDGPTRGATVCIVFPGAEAREQTVAEPTPTPITRPGAGGDADRALIESQLIMYAQDFKRMVERERTQRGALEQTQQQLARYAEDLNVAHRAERQRARHSDVAHKHTISLLTRVAGLRHAPTVRHQARVGGYVLVLARQLGLDDAHAHAMASASQLHDIGLIGVSNDILDSADPLEPPAWKAIRKHPVYGASLLEGDDQEAVLARSIALNHHERWDGSGYPNGIAGEAIPIEARIVAIADVYDSLRDAQPFRDALSHDEAVAVLLEGDARSRPEHFDPAVLTAFAETHDDFDRVFRQGRDDG